MPISVPLYFLILIYDWGIKANGTTQQTRATSSAPVSLSVTMVKPTADIPVWHRVETSRQKHGRWPSAIWRVVCWQPKISWAGRQMTVCCKLLVLLTACWSRTLGTFLNECVFYQQVNHQNGLQHVLGKVVLPGLLEDSLPRQVTIKRWATVCLWGWGTDDAEEWPHQVNMVIMKCKGGAVWLLCLFVLAFLMFARLTLLKGNRKGNFTLHTYFRVKLPSPRGQRTWNMASYLAGQRKNPRERVTSSKELQKLFFWHILLPEGCWGLKELPPPAQTLHVEWELPLLITQQYSSFSRAHGSSGELVPPGIVQGQFFQRVPAALWQSLSRTSLLPLALLRLSWLITMCIFLFYYKCVHLLPFTVLVFSIQMARMEGSLEWLTAAKLHVIIYICLVIPKHKHFT